jgi:hypothetical protein
MDLNGLAGKHAGSGAGKGSRGDGASRVSTDVKCPIIFEVLTIGWCPNTGFSEGKSKSIDSWQDL